MNGIEALNTMKEGKTVKTRYERQYRMVEDEIQYYNEGEWEPTEIELNVWINRDYELSSEPLTYNLTFFEAMCEAAHGRIVSNKEYPRFKYCMKDGILRMVGDILPTIQPSEIKAKWRIETEESE